ncbi:MAG: hypothetical protein CMJ52_07400 [Planctomycetaceae bacterium]|nr:hypothetical protein [Planctomycetaceae bacterium]
MKRRVRGIITITTVGVALVGSSVAGWAIGSGRLGGARDQIENRIATYRNVLLTVRSEREERPELDRRLADVLDRSLGSELESVDSDLRRRLAGLAEASGLREASVSTLGASVVPTPAVREFSRSGSERAFREEPDFAVLGANVSGRGPLDAVVRFLHGLDAAPWVKRVEYVRFDPDREGRIISLNARVSTIFVPGVEPAGELDVESPEPIRPIGRYTSMVDANPFAFEVEVPPPVTKPAPVTPPPPPRIDPRSRWMLTGVVEGPDGTEAWLRNVGSNQTIELLVGGSRRLDREVELQLDWAEGDIAGFRVGDETFRILIGSTLDRPLP